VSHISIDGGDEDATALSIGVTHRAFPSQAGVNLQSVNIRSSTLSFHDALTRSGISQPNLALIGAEFAFDAGQIGEWHLAADGAFSGGDGYMQVLAGARHRVSMGRVTGLFEGAFGYGGGGDVDSGGGALLRAGVGAGIPLADDVILELGIQRYWLLDVGATADAFTLSLTKLYLESYQTAGSGSGWSQKTGRSGLGVFHWDNAAVPERWLSKGCSQFER